MLRGAELGDPRIVVHDVDAHHQGSRLAGAPSCDPFRLRVVKRETFGRSGIQNLAIDDLRTHIGRDLAADIGALLASGATFDGKPLQARDIAVIVESHKDARCCHRALGDAGIAVGVHRRLRRVRLRGRRGLAGAVGGVRPAAPLGRGARRRGDDVLRRDGRDAWRRAATQLTDRVAETLREWAGHARERGVAAIFEAAQLSGMGDRVLSWQGGERHMTDLAHMTQLLQEAAHREHYNLPALRDWLRTQREERSGATERNRRLDSDAAAVQIMTVWVSKGLQYPVVYLPFAFNRNVQERELVLFHDGDTRCLHVGGKDSPDYDAVAALGRKEAASDDSRLTYVAMTRAQSQVVAWWSPAYDEPNGGLSRLLRGRGPGESTVPDRCFAGQDLGRRRDGAAAEVGGRGRAGDRGVGGGTAGCQFAADAERRRVSTSGTSTARSTRRGGARRTRV